VRAAAAAVRAHAAAAVRAAAAAVRARAARGAVLLEEKLHVSLRVRARLSCGERAAARGGVAALACADRRRDVQHSRACSGRGAALLPRCRWRRADVDHGAPRRWVSVTELSQHLHNLRGRIFLREGGSPIDTRCRLCRRSGSQP